MISKDQKVENYITNKTDFIQKHALDILYHTTYAASWTGLYSHA